MTPGTVLELGSEGTLGNNDFTPTALEKKKSCVAWQDTRRRNVQNAQRRRTDTNISNFILATVGRKRRFSQRCASQKPQYQDAVSPYLEDCPVDDCCRLLGVVFKTIYVIHRNIEVVPGGEKEALSSRRIENVAIHLNTNQQRTYEA